jgi:hypothetical protein
MFAWYLMFSLVVETSLGVNFGLQKGENNDITEARAL